MVAISLRYYQAACTRDGTTSSCAMLTCFGTEKDRGKKKTAGLLSRHKGE